MKNTQQSKRQSAQSFISLLTISLGFTLLLATGCGQSKDQIVQIAQDEAPKYLDINKYSLDKLICDPFSDERQNIDYKGGLYGQLYYKSTSDPVGFSSVNDFLSRGIKSNKSLFFANLFVPTRLFSTGFPVQTGGMVKDDAGNDLVEYFGIRFQSVMGLADTDPEGTYEFAVLSDDGAIWNFKENPNDANWLPLVNNDGNHPTRLGCGASRMEMFHGHELAMQLDYYQGPRYHISVIPLFRKVDANTPAETMCGQSGNSMWFDYNHNSTPTQNYLTLLSHGWKPLAAANYRIPDSAGFNPCANGVAPIISNFTVEDLLDGVLLATWNTDILAASQLRVVDAATGVEALTVSDNVLRTSHSVYKTGLLHGHTYLIQGISISETYGKAISTPLNIRMQ